MQKNRFYIDRDNPSWDKKFLGHHWEPIHPRPSLFSSSYLSQRKTSPLFQTPALDYFRLYAARTHPWVLRAQTSLVTKGFLSPLYFLPLQSGDNNTSPYILGSWWGALSSVSPARSRHLTKLALFEGRGPLEVEEEKLGKFATFVLLSVLASAASPSGPAFSPPQSLDQQDQAREVLSLGTWGPGQSNNDGLFLSAPSFPPFLFWFLKIKPFLKITIYWTLLPVTLILLY